MPLYATLDNVSIWWYGVWLSLNMVVFLERESYWIWIMTCVWPCLESKVPRWFALICYAVWVCHKVRDAEGWSERTTPCGSWVHRFEVQGGRRNDLTDGKQSLFCSSLAENPWVSPVQDLASLLKKIMHYIAFILFILFHWLSLPNVTLDLFLTGHVWGATKLVHGWCVQASLYFGQGGVGQNEMEGNHHPDLRQRLDPTSSIKFRFVSSSFLYSFCSFHFISPVVATTQNWPFVAAAPRWKSLTAPSWQSSTAVLLRPGCGGWPNCPGCIVSNMFTVHHGTSWKKHGFGGCLILRVDFNWLVVVFFNYCNRHDPQSPTLLGDGLGTSTG